MKMYVAVTEKDLRFCKEEDKEEGAGNCISYAFHTMEIHVLLFTIPCSYFYF